MNSKRESIAEKLGLSLEQLDAHERAMTAATTMDARARRRQMGKPHNSPPAGWSTEVDPDDRRYKRFRADIETRRVGEFCRERLQSGASRADVYSELLPHFRRWKRKSPLSYSQIMRLAGRSVLQWPLLYDYELDKEHAGWCNLPAIRAANQTSA